MPSTIFGSIIYKGKSYPFFLEGRKVNIVGKAWEYFEAFQDAGAEETISGITSDNRQIMFSVKITHVRTSLHRSVSTSR